MRLLSKKGFWVPPLIVATVLVLGILIKRAEFHLTEIRWSIWLSENQSPLPSAVSWMVAHELGPSAAVIITLTIALVLWVKRRDLEWLHFIAITFGAWLAAALVKPIVERARPVEALLTNPIHPQEGFLSFPSGHTAFSVGLFSAILLVVARTHRRKGAVLVALGVLVVAFSRVYAGAHFATDVIAGAVCAAAGVWFSQTLWQHFNAKDESDQPATSRDPSQPVA